MAERLPEEVDFKEIAAENMKKWLSSLLTKDPKAVADLYTDNNNFLPTVSGDFKKGKDGAESYFIHFLEKNPNGEVVDEEVVQTGPDSYVHSGMYNFTVGPDDNRQVVQARFTFVWQRGSDGEWKIVHHHSSVRPETH